MTKNEMKALERAQTMTDYPVYWVPITWASNLTVQAYEHGYIKGNGISLPWQLIICFIKTSFQEVGFLTSMIREMSKVQVKCREVHGYTLTCFPLVYTQVQNIFILFHCIINIICQIVTLTVYAFFLASVVGQQYIDPLHAHEDYWFPIFASLQFIFYVGWLKVAETLINPWGEDDDDFDTNYMVDRNIQFAFLLIDQVCRYFI